MNKAETKFLVDAGVGHLVEQFLNNFGYDIKSVRDIDPRMPDEEIIKLAYNENRIIITMDKDFGELVYHSLMPHAGILLLRLEDSDCIEKTKIVSNILKDYASQLSNAFCVYQNGKFRIRKFKK